MEIKITTDLNQGVVYGINTRETNLKKSFVPAFTMIIFSVPYLIDFYFSCHGTTAVIVWLRKTEKTFLNINDTLQCITWL